MTGCGGFFLMLPGYLLHGPCAYAGHETLVHTLREADPKAAVGRGGSDIFEQVADVWPPKSRLELLAKSSSCTRNRV